LGERRSVTYQGKVEKGLIVLEPGVQLPEGARVRIELEPVEAPTNGQQDDPLLRMKDLAVETGIPDLAANVDHYLYHHPKVTDGS
jgi:hypothetical protein